MASLVLWRLAAREFWDSGRGQRFRLRIRFLQAKVGRRDAALCVSGAWVFGWEGLAIEKSYIGLLLTAIVESFFVTIFVCVILLCRSGVISFESPILVMA